jgi:hypothetical protein
MMDYLLQIIFDKKQFQIQVPCKHQIEIDLRQVQ